MVICKAQINRKCIFSNNLIREDNLVSLYSKKQNKNFENFIFKIFEKLPEDIVELIIHFIGYKNKIGSYGLLNYTMWGKFTQFDKFMLKLLHNN